MIQMNLLTKQKETHREQIYIAGGGGGWEEGIGREFGMDVCTRLYLGEKVISLSYSSSILTPHGYI